MVEQAFKVLSTSSLYKTYFEAKEEKDKFHKLARAFFAKYDFIDDGKNTGYYMTDCLCMQLCQDDANRFAAQLKKLIDKNDMRYFKKNSTMNKAWQKEVVSHCDMNKLDGTWCWYWSYIGKGKYALWHSGEDLYGYLLDEYKDSLELPDWMVPIKMSEYYSIQEAMHDGK